MVEFDCAISSAKKMPPRVRATHKPSLKYVARGHFGKRRVLIPPPSHLLLRMESSTGTPQAEGIRILKMASLPAARATRSALIFLKKFPRGRADSCIREPDAPTCTEKEG